MLTHDEIALLKEVVEIAENDAEEVQNVHQHCDDSCAWHAHIKERLDLILRAKELLERLELAQ